MGIVVVGGGPAGAVAAMVLARAGRRVTLVEAAGPDAEPRVGEALPPAARPLLRDLGLLGRVERGSHLACPGNLSIWGGPEPRAHDFVRDPNGMGWHLDRSELDASLREAAAEQGVRVLMATSARRLDREEYGWRVELVAGAGDRKAIRCRWLIDATGRGGPMARHLGARRRRDDRLIAFAARARPEDGAPPDEDARTLIEAAFDGWWYSARLPRGERLIAFHTDPDLAHVPSLRTAKGFRRHLNAAPYLEALLAGHGYRLTGRPRGVDAGSTLLEPSGDDGWLAVGDAALSLDPLSSQGLYTALFTGLRGAEAVLGALSGDRVAVETYGQRLRSIYGAYLEHRASYYALETRWPNRDFWRRRSCVSEVTGGT